MLAAAAALVLPLAFSGESLPRAAVPAAFGAVETIIRRDETEHEWPFALPEGELVCLEMEGTKYVFFQEILSPEAMGTYGDMTLPRSVAVSANPLAYFATWEDRELILPFDSLETLVRRMAPFERMGWALCGSGDGGPAENN